MRKRSELTLFDDPSELESASRFFMVGIGGAGMSGLARLLKSEGRSVAGTDMADSDAVAMLRNLGIEVTVGHTGEPIREGDAVILSDAIDLETSPEVARARELGCPLLRRSQALAWVLRSKKLIAVTGTHGKTTTTGMVAAALVEAGLDPTIVVGAEVPQFGAAVVEGKGDWAVVEACEAYESYLDLHPEIAVVTNLELDHIDYHETWEKLLDSMRTFLGQAGEQAIISDDPGAKQAAEGLGIGVAVQDSEDWPGDLRHMAGDHFRVDAALALAAAKAAGADEPAAVRGIEGFSGAERRMQVIHDGDVLVVDDYAHHPTEITATIDALRELHPGRRMVVAFQPHLYSRTAELIPEFAEALSAADFVFLTDIYPAREAPMPGISSLRIAEALTVPFRYVPSRHLLPREVNSWAKEGDLVVGMGAGSIGEFARAFVAERTADRETVAVLCGGDNAEREVSRVSGHAIAAAVRELGREPLLIDPHDLLQSGKALEKLTGPQRPKCAVLALHGPNAEDGIGQAVCEVMHLPYCGSRVASSALAMDKEASKRVLAAEGIPVPRGVEVRAADAAVGVPLPVVVKPNRHGSTVGLTFVRQAEELEPAIRLALQYDESCLVEEMVEGVEISVPVMGDRALPAVEIVPASGSYDFASKYVPGATEEICPARITDDQQEEAARLALASHQALGCEGITRADMIVLPDRIVVLEINTIPGMTPTSLVPRSAEAAGMTFTDVVRYLIDHAR